MLLSSSSGPFIGFAAGFLSSSTVGASAPGQAELVLLGLVFMVARINGGAPCSNLLWEGMMDRDGSRLSQRLVQLTMAISGDAEKPAG